MVDEDERWEDEVLSLFSDLDFESKVLPLFSDLDSEDEVLPLGVERLDEAHSVMVTFD